MGLKSALEKVVRPEKPQRSPPKVPFRLTRDFRLREGGRVDPDRVQEAIKEQSRIPSVASTFQRGNNQIRGLSRARDNYEEAHYDLKELAKARDTESLINTSVERHVETVLQQGFRFVGENQEIVDWVNMRIFEIEHISKITLRKILEMLSDQVITYGTALLLTKRDQKRSSGAKTKIFGTVLDPIAAWAVPDTATMKVAENKQGNIVGWKQIINESSIHSNSGPKTKFFSPNNVHIFTRHKQAGRVFGRPTHISALDDVIMLRSLEDLVYVISQKYAFPLFQYVVGTKERPAEDVTLSSGELISEVELAQSVVENMPVEGGFVTPERHEIKLIGTEGKVLDLMPYIDHFKTRVQEATRMSNAALGTGTGEQSKSTAQTQMRNLELSAKYIQDVISDGLRWFISCLIAEGGYDVTIENMVHLQFAPPDTQEQRAAETHVMEMYNNDLLTGPEARKRLGCEECTEEEMKQTRGAIAHERDKELAKVGAAAKAASQASTQKKASTGSTSNKSRPANQSGKKSTKTRVKKNDYAAAVIKKWEDMKDVCFEHTPVKDEKALGYNRIASPVIDEIADITKKFLGTAIAEGAAKARADAKDPSLYVKLDHSKNIFHIVRQNYKKFFSDLVSTGFNGGNKVWINAAFEASDSKLRDLIEDQVRFVLNAAYIAALNSGDTENVQVIDENSGYSVKIQTADYAKKSVQLLTDSHLIALENNQ